MTDAAKERIAAGQVVDNFDSRLESNRDTQSNIDMTATNREFVNNPNNNINENSTYNQNNNETKKTSFSQNKTNNMRQKSATNKKKETKAPIQILPVGQIY